MIRESIHSKLKVGNIKFGGARVFGEDSDIRRKLRAFGRNEGLARGQTGQLLVRPGVSNSPSLAGKRAGELALATSRWVIAASFLIERDSESDAGLVPSASHS
jgi:hypothetical protein